MHRRSFPVLDEAEAGLVEELTAGLPRNAASVLAYLLARRTAEDVDDAASRLAVRVGTDLGRERTTDALGALEETALVERSSADTGTSGRPPDRWRATGDAAEAVERVRRRHAAALVERATEVAESLGGEPVGDGDTRPGSSLSVRLNWEPNGLQAPLFVAADEGLFAARSLDVSLTHRYGSSAAVDAVTSGDADVGLAGAATCLRARASGADVVPVALYVRQSLTVLYTTRDAFGARLESVEQLRGRRVATAVDSEAGLLGRLLLSQSGVVDDVCLRQVDAEEQAALTSGTVDAVTGVVTDPLRLRAAGHDVDVLAVTDYFPVPGPALVVRRETLANRSDALERFLAALGEGWATAREDPDAAARTVAAAGDAAVAAERRRVDVALDRYVDDVAAERGWGWQSPDEWQRLETALDQSALLC